MKLKKIVAPLLHLFVFTLLIGNGASAKDVAVIGSIPHFIGQPDSSFSLMQSDANNKNNTKIIQLLHVALSDEAKELLVSRAKETKNPIHQFPYAVVTSEKAEQVQLDMNNVPVLDQGIHGTCITFAITGALDAAIGKGDYISQLCHLQLGSYLEKHGYGLSGWDGNYAISVINQIEQYGVVNTEKQRSIGCGGFNQYPTYSKHDPNSFIDPEQYYPMSEKVFGKLMNWSNIYWRISSSWTLDEVKTALNTGDRVVFTVLLPRIDLGVVGAVGNYQTSKDTWVLTKDILYSVQNADAAHAMIITGYNDNAVAIDNLGNKHKGLLTLRNSWGSKMGDKGNFYMSYDYFKLLTYDARRISRN